MDSVWKGSEYRLIIPRRGRRWASSGSLPGWQCCGGISGSFRVEWVACFSRIRRYLEVFGAKQAHLIDSGVSHHVQAFGAINGNTMHIYTPIIQLLH